MGNFISLKVDIAGTGDFVGVSADSSCGARMLINIQNTSEPMMVIGGLKFPNPESEDILRGVYFEKLLCQWVISARNFPVIKGSFEIFEFEYTDDDGGFKIGLQALKPKVENEETQ